MSSNVQARVHAVENVSDRVNLMRKNRSSYVPSWVVCGSSGCVVTSPFVTGSEDTGLDSMTGIFSKRAGLERIKENHFLSYIDVVRIQQFEPKSGFSLQSMVTSRSWRVQ